MSVENIVHTPSSYFESCIWWHEEKKKGSIIKKEKQEVAFFFSVPFRHKVIWSLYLKKTKNHIIEGLNLMVSDYIFNLNRNAAVK